jgi:hypothetical protein
MRTLEAYPFAQLPGEIFAQQLGARRTLLIVGILRLVATLAFPLAPMLLAGAALFGALLLAQALLGVSKGPLFQRSNSSHRILTSDESTGDGDRCTAAGMNPRWRRHAAPCRVAE